MPQNEPTRRDVLRLGASVAVATMAPFAFSVVADDYDVVILNGRVIDPETKLDAIRHVGLRGNRIARVSDRELRGKKVIDARGLVVAPGFIDPISHGQDLANDQVQILDGVTTKLQLEAGVQDQANWHLLQQGQRIANYGAGYSHGHARTEVLGQDNGETGVATDADVAKMAILVDHQFKQGALALGFGLEYEPSSTRWEVIEMFRVAGEHGASCHCHTRYGTMMEEQSNLTAIEEVLAAAQVSGAGLHIVHVPSMALANTSKALEFLGRAQKRGLDVTADCYPYTAFGTGIESEVFAPGWQQRFGIDYKDLEWAATHERLTAETFEKYRKDKGMVLAYAIPESAVTAAVGSPVTMIGSDGGLENGVGHPRSAGTFSRVLARYVRDQKALSLPAALEKMSLKAARRMQKRCSIFRRKGRIQEGCDADIVAFDPTTVQDLATYDKPAQPSVGFKWVFVNGVAAVSEGKLDHNVRPGTGLSATIK